jgi:uncharacterized delta-60 repeat protein
MRLFGPRQSRSTTSVRRCSGFRPSLEALEARYVPSAAGSLDTSFGSGGIVTTSFGTRSNDYGFAVAVQADGKIVEAGGSLNNSKKNLDVIRYNSNGSLDGSFGSGGEVQTPFSNTTTSGSLILQPDGKILVGTTINNVGFELVRYNTNGTLDNTFGGTGMVGTSFNGNVASLSGLALETVNGVTEIVAVGETSLTTGHYGFALARYNLHGSLDSSFGSGGKVVTDLGYDLGAPSNCVAIQGDGQIIVAGTKSGSVDAFLTLRYGVTGNLDSTFGTGGVVTGTFDGNAGGLAVQPDGKIVETGHAYTNSAWSWVIERLNSDGSLDSSFGTGGIVVGGSPGSQGLANVVVQTNGKLVALGGGAHGVGGFELTRFNPDGSLDTTFGTNGQVNTSVNGGGTASDLAFQADDKIAVAGFAPSAKNGIPTIALARYWGDPVPVIGTLTANHNPVASGSNLTLTASNITDANPSSSITQVALYVDSSTGNGKLDTNDTLLGYATQTSPGVWTYTFTVNLIAGTYTIFAQAEDSLGVFSYADALTLTVQ